MNSQATAHKHKLASISVALIMLISIIATISYIPHVSALTLDAAAISNGWDANKQPFLTDSFVSGETVYLYLKVEDNQSYSLGSFPADSYRFRLTDPNGVVTNTFTTREFGSSQVSTINGPSGSNTVENTYLKVMDVNNAVQIGTWEISVYYQNTQIFNQNFEINAGQVIPSQTIPSYPDTSTNTPSNFDNGSPDITLGMTFVLLVMFVFLIVIVAVFVKKDQKHKQTLRPPLPQTNQ